jgi:hypothetical protein
MVKDIDFNWSSGGSATFRSGGSATFAKSLQSNAQALMMLMGN